MGKSTSISLTPELKKVLEEIKAGISETRRVTWNEVIDTLVKSYHGKRMTSIENKRLQHTITKIAVNQSKAGTYVTQQTLVPIQNTTAIAIPPPPPHLVPPPQLGEKDDKKALIRELDALFMENNGIPKLESAEKGRELMRVEKFLDDWVYWR